MHQLSIWIQNISSHSQSNVNTWYQISPQDHLILRKQYRQVSEHYPLILLKLSKLTDVRGLTIHDSFRRLNIEAVYIVRYMWVYVRLKFHIIILQSLWWHNIQHLTSSTSLQLFYTTLRCILPRRIQINLFKVPPSFLTLACKITFHLLFKTISYHTRWYTISLKH